MKYLMKYLYVLPFLIVCSSFCMEEDHSKKLLKNFYLLEDSCLEGKKLLADFYLLQDSCLKAGIGAQQFNTMITNKVFTTPDIRRVMELLDTINTILKQYCSKLENPELENEETGEDMLSLIDFIVKIKSACHARIALTKLAALECDSISIRPEHQSQSNVLNWVQKNLPCSNEVDEVVPRIKYNTYREMGEAFYKEYNPCNSVAINVALKDVYWLPKLDSKEMAKLFLQRRYEPNHKESRRESTNYCSSFSTYDFTTLCYLRDSCFVLGTKQGPLIGQEAPSVYKNDAQYYRAPRIENTKFNTSRVNDLAHCDNVLASGSDDGKVRLYKTSYNIWKHLKVGKEMVMGSHKSSVGSVCFNTGGDLVSGSKDETVCIWDIATQKPKQEFVNLGEINCLKTSFVRKINCLENSLRNVVIIGSGKMLKLLNPDGRCENKFQYNSPITCLDVSSDGSKIVVGEKNGEISMLDIKTGKKSHRYCFNQSVVGIHISPYQQLLTHLEDGTMQLWTLGDADLQMYRLDVGPHNQLGSFSPNGKKIAIIKKQIAALDYLTKGVESWPRTREYHLFDDSIANKDGLDAHEALEKRWLEFGEKGIRF